MQLWLFAHVDAGAAGVKYNIRVNAVSPVASTRLTQPLWPEDVANALTPELTAPIIVYLCHTSCTEAGSLFEVCMSGPLVSAALPVVP